MFANPFNEIVKKESNNLKEQMICEICYNLKGTCFKHKPPETKEQRQERKDMYISRAISYAHGMVETGVIAREASEKFEKENKC